MDMLAHRETHTAGSESGRGRFIGNRQCCWSWIASIATPRTPAAAGRRRCQYIQVKRLAPGQRGFFFSRKWHAIPPDPWRRGRWRCLLSRLWRWSGAKVISTN